MLTSRHSSCRRLVSGADIAAGGGAGRQVAAVAARRVRVGALAGAARRCAKCTFGTARRGNCLLPAAAAARLQLRLRQLALQTKLGQIQAGAALEQVLMRFWKVCGK